MKLEDKNTDFIDNFFNLFKPYHESGVRLLAIVVLFSVLWLGGTFLAPILIKQILSVLPFEITLLQNSPLEIFYNYLKIGFFFAAIIILPMFIYQFGKLKFSNPEFKEKMDLLLVSSVLSLIIIINIFLVYKVIFPLEITFLYGLNFNVTTFTSSLSSMVSTFITTFLMSVMLVLLPFLRYLIKKSLLFNYATLIKYKKIVMIYSAILAGILVLPLEIICLGLTFLVFFCMV